MRTPDQDERPEPGTADGALGQGFGTVGQADLNDGYGIADFYDDSYGYSDTIEPGGGDAADDTFDDASDDDGGFGTIGDEGPGAGDGEGEVIAVGNEVSESEAENILEAILDDVFGDGVDEVVADMEGSTGMDASEILEALGDADDDGGFGAFDPPDGGSGVFDNPFDGLGDPVDDPGLPEAGLTAPEDLGLTGDGRVDHADLHEAADPFDLHVDGG